MPPRLIVSIGISILLSLGCDRNHGRNLDTDSHHGSPASPATSAPATSFADEQMRPAVDHEHGRGAMGGVLTSLDDDAYHAEAVIEQGEVLAVYVRGADPAQLCEVSHQVLTAYIRRDDSRDSSVIALNPDPLPDGTPGTTSRFSGRLPENLRDQSLYIMIPGLRIEGQRYALRFKLDPGNNP